MRTQTTDHAQQMLAAHPRGAADPTLFDCLRVLRASDTVDRALELLAFDDVEVLPVITDEGALVGLLDRRAILGAYRRRIDELRT